MSKNFFSLLLIFVFVPSILSAQTPTRSGFFVGFGGGPGSFGGEDFEERSNSGTGFLRLGAALNDKILLGGEIEVWVKEEFGITVTNAGLNAVAYFYPDPMGGFYVKGGLGSAVIEVDTGILGSASQNGVGLTLGGGYDFGFGGSFALTPYAGVLFSKFEEGSSNVISFGLSVNWY